MTAYICKAEAMQRLGVRSGVTLWRYRRDGLLRSRYNGRSHDYLEVDVERLAAERDVAGPRPGQFGGVRP